MKKPFEFEDYKAFLIHWIESQPSRGRGLSRKIAQVLKIHSTMMSHILRGKQHLSEDQALVLSEYMGLTELETEYFLALVRLDRASTHKLKTRIRKELSTLQNQSREIKNRIIEHHKLSPEDSARFYSNWFYSAIRLLSDIPAYQFRTQLVEAFDLPRDVANEAVTFLIEKGLCREAEGRIVIGPSRTHLPADSPYIWTMHKNWRLKAIERHSKTLPGELFYTAPMSIAVEDVAKVRELILRLLEKVTKIAAASQPERLAVLNIDWFEIK